MINTIITCDKCGKEIKNDEPIWYINQDGIYGSVYDGSKIQKEICDSCLSNFLELEDENNE